MTDGNMNSVPAAPTDGDVLSWVPRDILIPEPKVQSNSSFNVMHTPEMYTNVAYLNAVSKLCSSQEHIVTNFVSAPGQLL